MAIIDTPPGDAPDGSKLYGPSKDEFNSLIRDQIMRFTHSPDQQPSQGRALLRFVLGALRRDPFRPAMPIMNPLGLLFETTARGLTTVGLFSIGVNLADAAIKHDPNRAVRVLGTTAATGLVMEGVATFAGVRAVPVVGEVVGGVFAGKDAYDAARSGHKARATASGIEATLYAISAAATAATVLDCWNPTVIAPAAVAAVAGGAAVVMTTARTLRDNWSTVSGLFNHWSNDFAAAVHAQPTLPTSAGMRPGQLAMA